LFGAQLVQYLLTQTVLAFCLGTKFHSPGSSGLLVITIKPEAKEKTSPRSTPYCFVSHKNIT
jgi:hypothetical protein